MQHKHDTQHLLIYLLPLMLILLLVVISPDAYASNGQDKWGLQPMIDDILNFLKGTGGMILGAIGLVMAVYHAAIKFDLQPAAIWFGVAIVILGAPNIINTVFSATI